MKKKRNPFSKPLFNLGTPKKVSKQKKNLSTKQALKTGISKWGDADRDGYLNVFDCKPFNPKKHGVYSKDIGKPVVSYVSPGLTYDKVFKKAEERLPLFKGEEGQEGGYASDILTQTLQRREEMHKKYGDTPFKKLVGEHKVELGTQSPLTPVIKHLAKNYLQRIHPDFTYQDTDDPTKLKRIDLQRGTFKDVSIGSELRVEPKDFIEVKPQIQGLKQQHLERAKVRVKTKVNPPWYLNQMITHFSKGKPMKMYITDEPVDILTKSTEQGWSSCEALPRRIDENVKMPWRDRGRLLELYGYESWEDEYGDEGWYNETGELGFDQYDGHQYALGPFYDVANLNAIAYLYNPKDDVKKSNPIGRSMLRWGHTYDPKKEEFFEVERKGVLPPTTEKEKGVGVDATVYGLRSEEEKEWIPYLAQSIIKKKGVPTSTKDLAIVSPERHGGYSDSIAYQSKAREISEQIDPGDDFDTTWDTAESDDTVLNVGRQPVYINERKKPRTSEYAYEESVDKIKRGLVEVPESIYFGLVKENLEDRSFIYDIAGHKTLPKSSANIIALSSTIPETRERIAKRPLDEPAAAHLMKTGIEQRDKELYSRAFFNPGTPTKMRKELFKSQVPFDPTSEQYFSTPHTPERARIGTEIGKFAIKTDFMSGLPGKSYNPSTIKVIYEDTLKKLKSNDPDIRVRAEIFIEGILSNPNTPVSIIEDYISTDFRHSEIKNFKIQNIRNIISNRYDDTSLMKKIFNKYKTNDQVLQSFINHNVFRRNTPERFKTEVAYIKRYELGDIKHEISHFSPRGRFEVMKKYPDTMNRLTFLDSYKDAYDSLSKKNKLEMAKIATKDLDTGSVSLLKHIIPYKDSEVQEYIYNELLTKIKTKKVNATDSNVYDVMVALVNNGTPRIREKIMSNVMGKEVLGIQQRTVTVKKKQAPKVGSRIRMKRLAPYGFTSEGSTGEIISFIGSQDVKIKFDYLAGDPDAHVPEIYTVQKEYIEVI